MQIAETLIALRPKRLDCMRRPREFPFRRPGRSSAGRAGAEPDTQTPALAQQAAAVSGVAMGRRADAPDLLDWVNSGGERHGEATMMTIVRVLATIFSGPFLLMGLIWIGQGFNLIPGSFMTGHIIWAIYGTPLALVGAALVWWLNRKPAAS
jgi:hypothetical protein